MGNLRGATGGRRDRAPKLYFFYVEFVEFVDAILFILFNSMSVRYS